MQDYKKTIDILYKEWIHKNLCQHRLDTVYKEMFLNDRILGIYRTELDKFNIDYFKKCIDNYAKILNFKTEYWYTYKWLFWEFIEKGYKKFSDEAQPLENFRKNTFKVINSGESYLR